MGDNIVNVESIDKHLAAVTKFLGTPLRLLRLRQYVDIPTCKLRCETNILTPPPYRQAQLIVRYDDLDPALFFIHDDLCDFRGRKCINDKSRRVRRPGNNVDLFAL